MNTIIATLVIELDSARKELVEVYASIDQVEKYREDTLDTVLFGEEYTDVSPEQELSEYWDDQMAMAEEAWRE